MSGYGGEGPKLLGITWAEACVGQYSLELSLHLKYLVALTWGNSDNSGRRSRAHGGALASWHGLAHPDRTVTMGLRMGRHRLCAHLPTRTH